MFDLILSMPNVVFIIKNSKRMTDGFQCTSMCIFFLLICEKHCCNFSQWLMQAKCLTVGIVYMSTTLSSQSKNFPWFRESTQAKQFLQASHSLFYNHFLKPVDGDTLRGLYPCYVEFCIELQFV